MGNREWGLGRMGNTFSFHEFNNFLLFNFLIIIMFLKTVFLPTTITHDPRPRPTTSTHDPRPTTFSYTLFYKSPGAHKSLRPFL